MADLVERLGEYSPKMVFAGEFHMLTDTGTAGEAVNQWDIIMLDAATGNVKRATTAGIDTVVGIAATAAAKNDPVVYYMTGEFFTDAIGMNDIEEATAKAALRKLSIFLR